MFVPPENVKEADIPANYTPKYNLAHMKHLRGVTLYSCRKSFMTNEVYCIHWFHLLKSTLITTTQVIKWNRSEGLYKDLSPHEFLSTLAKQINCEVSTISAHYLLTPLDYQRDLVPFVNERRSQVDFQFSEREVVKAFRTKLCHAQGVCSAQQREIYALRRMCKNLKAAQSRLQKRKKKVIMAENRIVGFVAIQVWYLCSFVLND